LIQDLTDYFDARTVLQSQAGIKDIAVLSLVTLTSAALEMTCAFVWLAWL